MTRTRTSSKTTTYTPAAQQLLASLSPYAAMGMLYAAQSLKLQESGGRKVPLSRLLTAEQYREHRNLNRRHAAARRRARGVA